MNNIKVLFFDVGGTIFDWKNTAREKVQELAGAKVGEIDSEAFANEGFAQQASSSFDVEARDFQELCSKLGVMQE